MSSVYVILCEAGRGEEHIKRAYEDALKETANNAMYGERPAADLTEPYEKPGLLIR